jgi:methyl-accepting chemotaxis protein
MLLKTLRKIPKTIGFRLTFWYSAIFIVSVSLLFFFAYIYLQTTLTHRDHAETLSKLRELRAFYQSGGIPLIEREIISFRKFPGKNKFFIRISDRNHQTKFLYLPYQWVEFNIKSLMAMPPVSQKWFRLPDQRHKVFLEINSMRLNNGDFLQVGQDTRERFRILTKFKDVTVIIILPLFLLGILGGSLLTYRALRPIRHLIDSVQSISHNMEALEKRVPNPHSGDELEKLIFLFNGMLQKIETLIKAMKNSLDNVAHDLRTPITRLRCVAELALQKGHLPEECQNVLGECLEESMDIQKLLDTLMDISEAEKLNGRSSRTTRIFVSVCKLSKY